MELAQPPAPRPRLFLDDQRSISSLWCALPVTNMGYGAQEGAEPAATAGAELVGTSAACGRRWLPPGRHRQARLAFRLEGMSDSRYGWTRPSSSHFLQVLSGTSNSCTFPSLLCPSALSRDRVAESRRESGILPSCKLRLWNRLIEPSPPFGANQQAPLQIVNPLVLFLSKIVLLFAMLSELHMTFGCIPFSVS